MRSKSLRGFCQESKGTPWPGGFGSLSGLPVLPGNSLEAASHVLCASTRPKIR